MYFHATAATAIALCHALQVAYSQLCSHTVCSMEGDTCTRVTNFSQTPNLGACLVNAQLQHQTSLLSMLHVSAVKALYMGCQLGPMFVCGRLPCFCGACPVAGGIYLQEAQRCHPHASKRLTVPSPCCHPAYGWCLLTFQDCTRDRECSYGAWADAYTGKLTCQGMAREVDCPYVGRDRTGFCKVSLKQCTDCGRSSGLTRKCLNITPKCKVNTSLQDDDIHRLATLQQC
jgi:hypothetical protein